MNWFKWFMCWWNRKHVPFNFYDENGKRHKRCIRCNMELE